MYFLRHACSVLLIVITVKVAIMFTGYFHPLNVWPNLKKSGNLQHLIGIRNLPSFFLSLER